MSKNNSYNSKNVKNDKNAAKNIRDNDDAGLDSIRADNSNELDSVADNSGNELDSISNNRTCIGRICNVQKNMFTILFEGREIPAKCRGSFYYDELEYPIVGDYVEFEYQTSGESRIVKVCKRKNMLKRPYPGDHSMKNSLEQGMVANVDYCFIVCSLNDNFNVNRILRYTAVAKAGEAVPVVVLTKADLCEDVEQYVSEVRQAAGDVRIHAVSAVSHAGMSELSKYCRAGATIALMGSSGVGKSTLINAISGSDIMKTGAVRESDSRGRHTTTARQLFTLPDGVTIIDTPGMRELGMCDAEEGIDDTFADIVELESRCKFKDCRHNTEPGCAIKAAIEAGSLTVQRYELYRGLKNESERNFNRKAVALKRRQINKKKR